MKPDIGAGANMLSEKAGIIGIAIATRQFVGTDDGRSVVGTQATAGGIYVAEIAGRAVFNREAGDGKSEPGSEDDGKKGKPGNRPHRVNYF